MMRKKLKSVFYLYFVYGVIFGFSMSFVIYSVYIFIFPDDKYMQSTLDMIDMIDELYPPSMTEFEQHISDWDEVDRAFAYMSYGGVKELFYLGSWTIKKTNKRMPTESERKCFRALRSANKGHEEYLTLLRIKYGKNVSGYMTID
jgi:hypothetical protein